MSLFLFFEDHLLNGGGPPVVVTAKLDFSVTTNSMYIPVI